MTSTYPVELHIYMESFEGESAYASYADFSVGGAISGYILSVSGYSGNAGDALAGVHHGKKFSTFDHDQDRSSGNCAALYKGAWWYGSCHYSNLNSQYLGGNHTSYADGINWRTWKGYYYSLKTTVMKIRRK